MPNTVLKFKCKTWTDESLKDPNFKEKLINPKGKVCPELKVIKFDKRRKIPNKKHNRRSTESWLEEMTREFDIKFKDFISISFHRPNKDIVDQSLLGKHIKKVILDFFYKNNKPENMINIWIFVEREGMFFRQGKNLEKEPIFNGQLHLHILLERVDLDWWFSTKNRDITIKKRHIHNFYRGYFPTKLELMRESLINHLKRNVKKIGSSKQAVDIKDSGETKKRIHYVNKSLSSVEFDKWEHIDFLNSDLPCCPVKRPIGKTNRIDSKGIRNTYM